MTWYIFIIFKQIVQVANSIKQPAAPNDLTQEPVLQPDHTELAATQHLHGSELEDNEDNDGNIVFGPTVEAHVNLAKTAGKCFDHYSN